MTKRERKLERALDGFDRTGDEELDALVDEADNLTARFAAAPPERPIGRALFIEGVGARRRSMLSSLLVPVLGAAALLVFIALVGRSALPGEALYPVREVLRTAGLAEAPTLELERELDDAALLLGKAQTSFDRGGRAVERFAVAALMSLGRAEGYIDELDASDRVMYGARIDALRTRAVTLIGLGVTLQDDDNSGSGSDDDSAEDGSDDDSGSGSDDSDDDDGSGSGDDDASDDSGNDSDSDDSSDDSSGSGSGSDDSGGGDSSGSGSGDDSRDAEDEADDLRDEQEDLLDERDD